MRKDEREQAKEAKYHNNLCDPKKIFTIAICQNSEASSTILILNPSLFSTRF